MSKALRIVLRSPVVRDDGKPVRIEDALAFLFQALEAPAGSKLRDKLLHAAMIAAVFGRANELKFRKRGDRRGRPRGTKARARHDDSAGHAYMERIARETGETNGRALAQQAIDAGVVPLNKAKPESVIRRLAKGWGKLL